MLSSLNCTGKKILSRFGMRFYHEKVNEHFKNPRNTGFMNANDDDVGTGIVGAPACGDALKFQIRVDENTGKIKEVKFRAFGCPAAVASSSLATTMIEGKTLDEALQVKNTAIANELNLPPVKLHCSMLAQDAIKAAVESYLKKHQPKQ
ncbi:Iron sulfur cluster assembly protein 1, mitochondrial [Histomonas meleagridis]|uniref:Iron sulfur cluster assembly protein 1, mitochondrial n=1 Tax=Histomonas meleagridis TaxID=135588 RepID=UPI003559615E|nr:Iron sulfur cluster assembly protein 1, mitochondrial [Histomonas meleagridis]KAH0801336.1 Iron sulfur cluster assembly protein 1, mitochondrial [Histomonas meleagridis]